MSDRGKAVKTVRISETTHEVLEERKRPDETHDDVVWRMLQEAAAVESVDDVSDMESAAALAELQRRKAERRAEELEQTVKKLQTRMRMAHEQLTAEAVGTDDAGDTSPDSDASDGVEAVIEEADPEHTDTIRDATHAPVWSVRHPDNSVGSSQTVDSDDDEFDISQYILDHDT